MIRRSRGVFRRDGGGEFDDRFIAHGGAFLGQVSDARRRVRR